ncbi:MAG: peptidoglycan DD-metalloendopeptidase family protein [Actinomycetota bacterium]
MEIESKDLSIFRIFQIVSLFLILFLVIPTISIASPLKKKRLQVSQIRNQIYNLNKKLNKLAMEYNSAQIKLARIDANIEKTTAKLEAAKKELEHRQVILNQRINFLYRCGHVEFLDMLFGSKTFSEFLMRFDLIQAIGEQDLNNLNEIKRILAEIERMKNELTAQSARQRALLGSLKAKQREMEKELAKQKSLFSRTQAQLIRLRMNQHRPRKLVVATRSRTYRRGGFHFPVAGPHAYCDSWGAPRRGHRHQGCDIFALRGIPCVACVSGTVKATYSSGGGKTIYLYGDDGNTYCYMHLSGYAVTGGHVEAGQTIGYVGNTGNARGASPHLHFEFHPGGGRAVNPYPVLKASE